MLDKNGIEIQIGRFSLVFPEDPSNFKKYSGTVNKVIGFKTTCVEVIRMIDNERNNWEPQKILQISNEEAMIYILET